MHSPRCVQATTLRADFLTANRDVGGQQCLGANNIVVATASKKLGPPCASFVGERPRHLDRRRSGERPQEGVKGNQGAPSVQSSHGPNAPGYAARQFFRHELASQPGMSAVEEFLTREREVVFWRPLLLEIEDFRV